MKILLDVRKINGSFNYKGAMKVKFKFGDSIIFTTEPTYNNDGSFAFLEKHTFTSKTEVDRSLVEITLLSESNTVITQITVFFIKFKEFHKIELKNEGEVYRLYYTLQEIAEVQTSTYNKLKLNRTSSIEQEPTVLKEESGKLEILRLGVLMYNFAQRLDPLIYLYNNIVNVIAWKNPFFTIGLGIVFTIVIYNIKMSIFLAGILLYFGKDKLLQKLSRVHRYRNIHKRVIVPQQNAYFLQHGMDNYCQAYETICEFLFNDDKTMLVNIIQLLCKFGGFLIILLFIFGVEHLLVLTLWSALLLTSPYRNGLISHIRPFFSYVAGEYDRVVNRISTELFIVLGSASKIRQQESQRQFYYFEYERWWVLKGWLDQAKKYSDEDYECTVFRPDKAPEGWAWIEDWKIEFMSNVDPQGYQYSNDLTSEWKSSSTLATRRRRRWRRTCIKLREL